MFGGELVIGDVCVECNGGPLSRLDEAVKRYWDSGMDSQEELDLLDREQMARWVAKVSFNTQRAVFALGTAGEEPKMPEDLGAWVLSGGAAPSALALSISRMPVGHRDWTAVGTFGSNGTALPRRILKLRGFVFLVAWDVPGKPGAAAEVAAFDRKRMPAIDLLENAARVAIPLVTDPEVVLRGFWGNSELLERMAKRYPPDPPAVP